MSGIWMETEEVSKFLDAIHHDTWRVIALALAELLITYMLGGLAKKAIMKLSNKAIYKGVMTFSASLVSIAIRVVGVIIALDQLGVSMNIIIGTMSGLGVGIALALKENMASVVSGMQILVTRPFEIGDYIRIGKHQGKVTSIEITYITLLQDDQEIVVIPNNRMISKDVTNFSNAPIKKMTITVPARREDLDGLQEVLVQKALDCPLVLKDPAPAARITELQMQNASIDLIFYTPQKDCWKAYDEVMDAVRRYEPDRQNTILPGKSGAEITDSSSNEEQTKS